MTVRRHPGLAALIVVVALLAAVASVAGIALRGDLATEPWTTLRGETIDVVTDGVYAWNSLPVVSEGVGWDIVTLALAVPGLLLAAVGVARGSLRWSLVALGFLAYVLYQYAEYAVFWAVGPMYPLHVLTMALAVSAIGWLLGTLDLERVAGQVTDRFPRRGVAGLGSLMVVVLAGLWLPTVARVVAGGEVQGILDGGVTLVVPAFDLGLLVPLGILTAVAAWRRLPAGYVLATTVVVKGVTMATAIVAMLLVEWATTGVLAAPPIVVFATVAVIFAAVGLRVFRSVLEPAPASAGGDAAVAPAPAPA